MILKFLCNTFPNISFALRTFLTLPVTVAAAERSFSKLKFFKNYLRPAIHQPRLSNLAIISLESAILDGREGAKLALQTGTNKANGGPAQ